MTCETRNKIIYLDNAATTPLDERVLEKMTPYLSGVYGNADSLHSVGRAAMNGLDEARETVAAIIGAKFNEVYFTSGGTEGDNFALRGAAAVRGEKRKLVLSSVEHAAMIKTASYLKDVETVFVRPDKNGIVSAKDYDIQGAFLYCLMSANNETGMIQPVKEACAFAHENGGLFFTDAVQSMGVTDVNVKDTDVDMMSFSAHKFYGPKGVGGMYIKNGTNIPPIISGGRQERGLRGGTSDVAGAVGLAEALKISRENLVKDNERIKNLRDLFIDKILYSLDFASLNGGREGRLAGNANIRFSGVSGELLLCALDLNGVCASLGAACSAGSVEPSYVLKEMGLSDKEAKESLRFTFGRQNTVEEVDAAVEIIRREASALRAK